MGTKGMGTKGMGTKDPVAELEPQFSSDDATATPWAQARKQLETAEIYQKRPAECPCL